MDCTLRCIVRCSEVDTAVQRPDPPRPRAVGSYPRLGFTIAPSPAPAAAPATPAAPAAPAAPSPAPAATPATPAAPLILLLLLLLLLLHLLLLLPLLILLLLLLLLLMLLLLVLLLLLLLLQNPSVCLPSILLGICTFKTNNAIPKVFL